MEEKEHNKNNNDVKDVIEDLRLKSWIKKNEKYLIKYLKKNLIFINYFTKYNNNKFSLTTQLYLDTKPITKLCNHETFFYDEEMSKEFSELKIKNNELEHRLKILEKILYGQKNHR